MKNLTFYSFIYSMLIVGSFSCNQKAEDKSQEDPTTISNPKLREETGGTPDESSTLVTSSFKSPGMQCKSGFGLCNPQFLDPLALYPDSAKTKVNQNEKTYKAVFYLGTADSTLTIDFDEEIPHFESYFMVKKEDTLKNVLGHEYIIPIAGNYKTEKDVKSKYGRVTIKVIKGKEKTEFHTKQKSS